MVWTCRILASGNDGKIDDVVTFGEQPRRDVGRHLCLGATNERDLPGVQLCSDTVRSGAGRSKCRDFCGVLGHPQSTDDIDRAHESSTWDEW